MVDRDKVDFDPDEGLYSGTAVDGTSEIPGPHEEQEDVEGTGPPENEDEYAKQRRASPTTTSPTSPERPVRRGRVGEASNVIMLGWAR